ncbi:MAG TPA: hypothetical protein VFU32_05285 [Ktedonobacterales bacterium]|nr:hypothetical protein [Ktedonobacterales bacterium]
MSLPPVSVGAIVDTGPTKGGEPRMRGGALFLARGVWLVFVAVLLANLVPSIPAYYLLQHRICDDPANCLTFGQATPGKLLALQRLGLSLDAFALYTVGLQLAVTLVFLVMGALIFWRKSDTWLGLLASFCLVLLGCFGMFANLAVPLDTATSPPALWWLANQMFTAADPALVIFLLLFPTGRFTPRWTWVVGLLGVANNVFFNLPTPYSFFYWPSVLQASYILLIFVSIIAVQVYRYRRVYTPTERQQTKWLVSGFAWGVLLFAFFTFGLPIVPGLNAPDSPLQLLDSVGAALLYISLPVGVGIAILRYRLWDIDSLINRALVYGTLTALLAGVYAGLILGLESLVGLFTSQASQPVVIVVSTLAIAALFQPLRQRIQNLIDRRFYRRKYDAARTLVAFSATLRQEVHLEQLRQDLLAVIEETMQPAHISLWLRSPEQHPPVQIHRQEPRDPE